MNTTRFLTVLGLLLGGATAGQATIIGFGQLGSSNTAVPSNLGSNAVADGNGYVVTNGTTPNISLTWDADWDIHTSTWFNDLEFHNDGGGIWDNEGNNNPRIGQLDFGSHNIVFGADPGYSLVLVSFDFAHTNEQTNNNPGNTYTTEWRVSLLDSSSTEVWGQDVIFNDGQVYTISPNFVGAAGASYMLLFQRRAEFGTDAAGGSLTYNSNGRHGIDNLTFQQRAVPEPGAVALLSLAGAAFLRRRRQ